MRPLSDKDLADIEEALDMMKCCNSIEFAFENTEMPITSNEFIMCIKTLIAEYDKLGSRQSK